MVLMLLVVVVLLVAAGFAEGFHYGQTRARRQAAEQALRERLAAIPFYGEAGS